MQINFDVGQAKKDIDGNNCDNCFWCYNPCDPYMVVKIDGVQKFRTSRTLWDNESPTFNQVFTTESIPKNANIAIEMWDDDAGDTSDDLMSKWEHLQFTSKLKSYTLDDSRNKLYITAQWK